MAKDAKGGPYDRGGSFNPYDPRMTTARRKKANDTRQRRNRDRRRLYKQHGACCAFR
eukprot:CAMPEP_0176150278 /NCGR_PEP_ID=MMETSP0120_2-20121206/76712_1 /TAXON_ID=160619 /ORGANISM="Kryptoperidinium foliaceum, Strain CCMP 1326" /LENGTH=56 /DNA_ID=CAMNT_0017487157 /DNA_START=35 /DNA_END=202 /DNA_ORIENTATION=-